MRRYQSIVHLQTFLHFIPGSSASSLPSRALLAFACSCADISLIVAASSSTEYACSVAPWDFACPQPNGFPLKAVKSSRSLGALVLSPKQSTENCDFSQPDIKRRLLDMLSSLQIYALASKAVSNITLASLDADSVRQWIDRLRQLQKGERYELVTYTSLELISKFSPYRTIRAVYLELLRLLFWGNSLHGMRVDKEFIILYFAPCFQRMINSLEKLDFACYSATLEELLLRELKVTAEQLAHQGIREAENILIPGEDECWD